MSRWWLTALCMAAASACSSPSSISSDPVGPTTITLAAPTAAPTVPPPTVPPTIATVATIPTIATTSTSTSTVPPTTATIATTSTSTIATIATTSTSTSTATIATTSTIEASTTDEVRQLGTSVQGRPIEAVRRGSPGGRVVLVIGVIHGDEPAGSQVVDRLEQLDVPAGIDLWLVPSMNPDGEAANTRQNADGVDLNRNFPADWGPIGQPGDSQYAGPAAASEPETQAIIAFIEDVQPDLVIWYHQDLNRIAPSTGRDGVIRARYAELTGLPIARITGGKYTGVASTWAKRTIAPGVAFIVELGPTLSDAQADVHARAVLTLASEPN